MGFMFHGKVQNFPIESLKPLSHWAATVGDNLRTAFAREFPKCPETLAGVLNSFP